ncbi:unnamed protein product [Angiostrongylus costaricensis]|uniref:PlsC domain-containing protein n=1 Tax=Angiostrongylus costaricensis TaxID=334426 RepID=A0A0R3PK70_ANGCS|nr:unnamed protein product [Angiostrongylus costaricensis]
MDALKWHAFLRRVVDLFMPIVGWIFGISILATSLFGSYIVSLFLFLLVMGKHNTWRSVIDRSVSFWMMVPIGFLELIFGMRVRVSGDEIEYDKPALIVMNHRTRLDWMYMWSALYQMNPWLIVSNKISLKAQLQSLPGAGFGMSAAHFLFLQRNKEKDAVTFSNAIQYFSAMRNNYQNDACRKHSRDPAVVQQHTGVGSKVLEWEENVLLSTGNSAYEARVPNRSVSVKENTKAGEEE